jgi:FERM C-terminal PH-like domain
VRLLSIQCEQYTTTIAFKMGSHDLAKRFWRLCIDHHSFFRLVNVDIHRTGPRMIDGTAVQ